MKGPQVVSLAGSWGTKFNDNIIADNDWAGGAWAQGYGSGTFYVAFNDFRRDQITNVYSLEAYKKYDIMHRLYWGSSWLAWGFEINGNIMYNNKQQFQLAAGVTELGITLDNCLIDSAVDSNMFNDPDNGDYTIKEDYEMPKGYEGVKEIKLEDIGLYESETRDDISAPLSDFKLYYPYDYTDSLQGRDVYLQWEQCINADRYKVEIALDENFESLVGTYDATEPYLYVDDLDNDATEYFWRVKAYQFGKDTKAEKYNSDGIRRFRTQDFDIVDTSALAEIIVKAEDIISKVTEGTEPGNIAFGASNNLKELVKTGKEYIELGKCLQTDVDNLVTLIEKEIGTIGKTVTRRYSTFTDILSAKDAWVTQSENNTDLTAFDGGAKLKTTGDEMVIYTNTSQPIENNMLYKFKVNSYIPYGSGGGVWQAICFQKKEDAGRKLWTTQKIGYMFLIKYNQIEVQLWDGAQNIIATIPNTLKSGGDSECTFGVLDFGAGQRIILEIDGETVFDHIEFDHIVRDDLYLSLWEPMETNDIYSTGGIAIMDVNPEDVPDNEVTLGTEASMGENDMKSILGSISGGEVKVSGGTKMSSEKTDNLKTIDFNIKPSLSSADQGVIFRASDTSFNEDTSNYYKLSFKSGKLILSKNNGGVKQNVAIARTDAIKSNEWNTMKISTNFENGGLRIIVYAGGREVINVYDSQAINKAGYFGVFNNSSSELTVKP